LQAAASMSQSMIGMALHSMGHCPVDISLLPREIKKQYELDARKSYFYASMIALVACLLISVVGIGQVLGFEKERVRQVEDEVAIADKEVAKVNALVGQLNVMKGNYDQSKRFLDARNQYTQILSELQDMMPDRMWLVTLEPYIEEEESYAGADEYGVDRNAAANGKKNEGPDARMTPRDYNALREVKQLRLVGYIVRLSAVDEDQNILLKFEERIKSKSQFFETENIRYRDTVDNNSNLTYFEFILTLKEAIKK
jgi:Tfp pilus assembly protein PilN